MEASGIPNDNSTKEFKHCLEGKARVWYDEIDVPTDWDDLSEKFCQSFCIMAEHQRNGITNEIRCHSTHIQTMTLKISSWK